MRVLFPAVITGITAAALVPALLAAQASQTGNATHGGQLFLQCRACHSVDRGAASSVGPNLAGVVGRKAASLPGYDYSAVLAKSGLTWTPETLDSFLKRPSADVPGTKMGFAGVASPQARADIIAYLATIKAKK